MLHTHHKNVMVCEYINTSVIAHTTSQFYIKNLKLFNVCDMSFLTFEFRSQSN